MKQLLRFLERLLSLARQLNWLPPLLARVSMGTVFFYSGLGKLRHIDKTIEFFSSIGVPAPEFQAHFVAFNEVIFGLCILVGFLTRLASIPLGAIMLVALWTAKRSDIASFSDLYVNYEYTFLLLLLWLITAGPGAVSIDRLFWKRLHSNTPRTRTD